MPGYFGMPSPRGALDSGSHEGLRASFLDESVVLVEDPAVPGHHAAPAVAAGFEGSTRETPWIVSPKTIG